MRAAPLQFVGSSRPLTDAFSLPSHHQWSAFAGSRVCGSPVRPPGLRPSPDWPPRLLPSTASLQLLPRCKHLDSRSRSAACVTFTPCRDSPLALGPSPALLSCSSPCVPLRQRSSASPLPVRVAAFLRPDAATRRVPFRPRGLSPPRRLAPRSGSRACCIPEPAMGSAAFRSPGVLPRHRSVDCCGSGWDRPTRSSRRASHPPEVSPPRQPHPVSRTVALLPLTASLSAPLRAVL